MLFTVTAVVVTCFTFDSGPGLLVWSTASADKALYWILATLDLVDWFSSGRKEAIA